MIISNSQKEIDIIKSKRSFISRRDLLSLSPSESKIDFCEATASKNIPSTYFTCGRNGFRTSLYGENLS